LFSNRDRRLGGVGKGISRDSYDSRVAPSIDDRLVEILTSSIRRTGLVEEIVKAQEATHTPDIIEFFVARRQKFSKIYFANTIVILATIYKLGRVRFSELCRILGMKSGKLYSYIEELRENKFIDVEREGSKKYIVANENTRKALIRIKEFIEKTLKELMEEYEKTRKWLDVNTN